jgi:hypothetical protein
MATPGGLRLKGPISGTRTLCGHDAELPRQMLGYSTVCLMSPDDYESASHRVGCLRSARVLERAVRFFWRHWPEFLPILPMVRDGTGHRDRQDIFHTYVPVRPGWGASGPTGTVPVCPSCPGHAARHTKLSKLRTNPFSWSLSLARWNAFFLASAVSVAESACRAQ